MEELNIQTCNEFKDYFFYEVLQGLIKVQIINEDLKKVLYPQQDIHFRIDQERFKRAAGCKNFQSCLLSFFSRSEEA